MVANSHATVLIVEDDRPTRIALAKLLEASGFVVATASSLAEARSKVKGQRVVVLDLILPDGDGQELLTWLRSTRHPAKVVIISATLDPAPYSHPRWVHAPDASFAKPLDVDGLILSLRSLLPQTWGGGGARVALDLRRPT